MQLHTRAISLARSLHPDYVLFTNNSASAFQKKSRSAIERRLLRHFPSMVPFYKVYYNDPSNLYYDSTSSPHLQEPSRAARLVAFCIA